MASTDATIEANRLLQGERGFARPRLATLAPPPVSPMDYADSGEPLDDPPPLVELVGFDEPARPGPAAPRVEPPRRRSFLAPLAPSYGRRAAVPEAPAPSPVMAPAEPEPAAAEPEPAAAPSRWPQLPARLPGVARQWRAAVAKISTGHRVQILYWARWAVAAAAIVAVIYVGLRPFSGSVPVQRTAAAPSDPVQRLAYFQKGAQAGDPEAELQLAILYAKGEGVAQDYATAATWFRAAAEQGSTRAQYDLGIMYERGRGVPADAEQAANWYRKAAEGKYPLAEYNLAVAYTKGQGTRKDLTEASLWYRRAAGQGVVQAMVTLGMLYERGDGVPVSLVDAYAWYLAAGRRGEQAAARRAEDVFTAMSRQDQIRAQALASDVAGSIHDAAPGSAATPAG